jgi:hypothetical protein
LPFVFCAELNSAAKNVMPGWIMLKRKGEAEPKKANESAIPVGSGKQGCAPSFLTQQKDEIGKVCGPAQQGSKQEYVQPDEEKDAGGEA